MKIQVFQESGHRKSLLGIPVISEIEFAAPFTNAITIGITGSNGKTTTTMLTYHLLKSAGGECRIRKHRKKFAWQVADEFRFLCPRIK
jgi:UDP-N-acetylmuramoylalanine--D-glutamate ligase